MNEAEIINLIDKFIGVGLYIWMFIRYLKVKDKIIEAIYFSALWLYLLLGTLK